MVCVCSACVVFVKCLCGVCVVLVFCASTSSACVVCK